MPAKKKEHKIKVQKLQASAKNLDKKKQKNIKGGAPPVTLFGGIAPDALAKDAS